MSAFQSASKISALALFAALASGCLASVRPATLSDVPPVAGAEEQGRVLLARAAKSYGEDAARRAGHVEFEMTDRWRGMAAMMANPWPQRRAHVQMTYRIGTFDAEAKFLSGKKEGAAWGLRDWKTYEVSPGGELAYTDNDDARFILAALHYQFEFPLRAAEAELVAYAGPREVNGRTYETVFVTWGGYEAHGDADQYVAYLDPETGRLEKLEHTIRDFAKFATSVVHFEDFREFDGVTLPMTMTINGSVEDEDGKGYMHRVSVDPNTVRLGGSPTFAVDAGPASVASGT